MSQRIDRGPVFRPRAVGAAPSSSSASSAATPTKAPTAAQPPKEPSQAATQQGATSAPLADDGASSSGALTQPASAQLSSSSSGGSSGDGSRGTGSTSIMPGQPRPSQRIAPGARPPPRSIAPAAPQAIGVPTPPSSARPLIQQQQNGVAPRTLITPAAAQEVHATAPTSSSSRVDDDAAEGREIQQLKAERDPRQAGQGDGEQESTTRPRRSARSKRLTVDEQEAAYAEQLAQDGHDLAASRPAPEDVSMASLAAHEVPAGKASKRTFDMMRKHDEYKAEMREERRRLVEYLKRKRQAGKDWNDAFSDHEGEESVQDQKRKRGAGGEAGRIGDEDEGHMDSADVERILAREAGDDSSDDGNSMSSDEGSDQEQAPSSSRTSARGARDKRTPAAATPPSSSSSRRDRDRDRASTSTSTRRGAHAASSSDSSSDSDDDDEALYGESQAALQIRIGPDGRPVLSESSLTIDPGVLAAEATDGGGLEGVTKIIETERFINTSTRQRKSINARWSADDTDKFFRAISQWGTDFEMIARLFPTRSRRQIKLKFAREEKQNPDRVTKAFKTRIPVDLAAYGLAVGRDLSGPPPKVSIRKSEEYLKMEAQERLLRGEGGHGGVIGERAAQTGAVSGSGGGRAVPRAGVEQGTQGGRGDAASSSRFTPGSSSGGGGRRRAGSHSSTTTTATPGGTSTGTGTTPSSTTPITPAATTSSSSSIRPAHRRATYDRERERERAKALAEAQRRERERLHRAGSGRGGAGGGAGLGLAYESYERVLDDAD